MKKILALFVLVLAFAAVLAACNTTKPAETTAPAANGGDFRVGYARVDITPKQTVPMGGYSDGRLSTGVKDPLYATAIAFSNGDNTPLVLICLDLTRSYSEIIPTVRMHISEKTGIPFDNILTTASHTHSSPDLAMTSHPGIAEYNAALGDVVLGAVNEALADRKPAEMYTTYTRATGLNTTRHYLLDNGTFAGNGCDFSVGKILGHVGVADNLLQLVKFTREGGKDVVLANWQGHYKDGKDTVFTADFFGVMRTQLEDQMDCHFAYIAGAGGDGINTKGKINGEITTTDYIDHGKTLSALAIEAAKKFEKAETGKVQVLKSIYPAPMKSNPNVTMDVTLYTFSLGEVAFACAPYEMFGINGLTIKENSDFKMTFVATQCNMHLFYVPAEYGFYENSYEGGVSRLAKGSGEALADEFGKMLDELHAQTGLQPYKQADDYFFKVPEPATNGVTYINLNAGDLTACEATPSGGYLLNLMSSEGNVRIVAKDEALAKKILAETTMTLTFDYSGFAVGVEGGSSQGITAHKEPGTVTAIKNNTVTITNEAGASTDYTLSDSYIALDMRAGMGGAETDLQTKDVVTWLADKDGKIIHLFISSRELTKKLCAHCNQEVEWTQWFRGTTLPANPNGHYILMNNVNLKKEYTVASKCMLVLDLNGYDVTGAMDARTLIVKGGTLNIMDTSDGAKGKVVARGFHTSAGRCVVVSNGTLNLYSGTLDGSEAISTANGCTVQCASGSGFINMYGGTIIGGRTESSASEGGNGGAVSVANKMTMYGGLITGGKAIGYDEGGSIGRGGNGGAVYVASTGTFIMEGGHIEGGKADVEGDNLYVGSVGSSSGIFIHRGGTIEGQ